MDERTCPFCEIIADHSKLVTPLIHEWPDAILLVPLNPCAPGHLMVIPKAHVEDAIQDPIVTIAAMGRAVSVATRHSHIIANAGWRAEQTIPHLHIHIIPRRVGDGLKMPWSP
jgi:histidine triad (HIT) family protein